MQLDIEVRENLNNQQNLKINKGIIVSNKNSFVLNLPLHPDDQVH